jgi:predicted PurR-regulated permease PerM
MLLASDTTDAAALIVAVATVVAVFAVAIGIFVLVRTMRSLRETVETLRTQTIPVINDLRDTVQQANTDLERVDGLLGTAESISGTVDSASRLAYLAFSNPVIKAMAFAAGTGRAAKRFRRGKE